MSLVSEEVHLKALCNRSYSTVSPMYVIPLRWLWSLGHQWHLHITLQNVWLIYPNESSSHTSLLSACGPCTTETITFTHLPPVCVLTMATMTSSHSSLMCVTCQPWYPCILLLSLEHAHHENSGTHTSFIGWLLQQDNSGKHISSSTVHVLITMTSVASCPTVCGLFTILIIEFKDPSSLCMWWPVCHGNTGIYTSFSTVCGSFTMTTLVPSLYSFIAWGIFTMTTMILSSVLWTLQ